jgi:hypothetical protein
MRHHNSVFHGLLKHVPWDVFEGLLKAHAADRRVRRLSTKSQLVALLYGQLEGAVSLREIEADWKATRADFITSAPRRCGLAQSGFQRDRILPCRRPSSCHAISQKPEGSSRRVPRL